MTAEQRPCLHCGTVFTWTPATPRKRFCSQDCRLSWWGGQRRGKPRPRHRRQNPPDSQQRAAATSAEPQPDTVLAATPACPYCRRPVAIAAWLVPPAAHATTPPRHDATPCDTPQR
jgi:endogenous inhibitor of DNA gyrase (YacG/DUF329 family)